MEKILVLTDFSKIANRGLEAAVHLAQQLGGAEILLLNTEVDASGRRFSASADFSHDTLHEDDRFMIELIKTNKKRLVNLVENYAQEGVTLSPYMEIGPMQDIVNDFLEAHQVDIIVMGTSGESTMEEYFVGNHTEQVIRVADVPVISVKLSDQKVNYRNIVLATDMGKDASRGMKPVQALASKLGAKIHLVHVTSKDTEKVKQKIEEYALSSGLVNPTVSVVQSSDTEDGINKYAIEIGADLIAVITHGRSGLSAMVSHSVAEGVIREASIPVLTVNMKEVK